MPVCRIVASRPRLHTVPRALRRMEHGRVTCVDEPTGVSGIGDKVFGQLRDRLRV